MWSNIAEIAEQIVRSGAESVGLPPSMELAHQTVGNIESISRELGGNLFELRYSIIQGTYFRTFITKLFYLSPSS